MTRQLVFCLMTTFLAGCAAPTGSSRPSLDDIRANKTERRTIGARAEDVAISLKIYNRMKERFGTDTIEIKSIVFNRVVTLVGSVSSREDAKVAANLAAQIENVRSVINELSVGTLRTGAEKSDDERLEAQTLNAIGSIAAFNKSLVKVTSYRRRVYLMGIVFEDEAKLATESASRVPGARSIVRAFEIVGGLTTPSAPNATTNPNTITPIPPLFPPPTNANPSPAQPITSQPVREPDRQGPELTKGAGGNDLEKRMNDTKSKCTDLGFKPQTEKFGDCVLRLSR